MNSLAHTRGHFSAGLALFLAAALLLIWSPEVEARRFIIKLTPGVDIQPVIDRAAASRGARISVRRARIIASSVKPVRRLGRAAPGGASTSVNPLERALFVVSRDTGLTTEDIRQLVGGVNVEYVEEDPQLILFTVPSDPYFGQQWHLLNDGQPYAAIERIEGFENDILTVDSGFSGEDIGLRANYTAPYPVRRRPRIAIIDTGVDDLHPELAGQIWINADEIAGNGIDDDHNGLVDDIRGYDFSGDSLSLDAAYADNDPSDPVGHGSHIAGIIAALPDGEGVVGVCPQALLMPLKIFPNAFATVASEAIVYAVNSGADVISVSWGSPFRSRLLDEVFAYAIASGVFVAVASGNSGDNRRFQPADIEALFTVGATNSRGYVT
ncbi:MAG: S8 family serine peptidase, partial [Candidatus Zixiibacteriota bacterium]